MRISANHQNLYKMNKKGGIHHEKVYQDIMRYLGISLIVLSIILTVSSIAITGYSTGYSVIERVIDENFKVLGVIFFLGGLVLLWIAHTEDSREAASTTAATAVLEERVEPSIHVYCTHKDPNSKSFKAERDYHITDPNNDWGGESTSLGEFRKKMTEAKSVGTLEYIQQVDGPKLRKIAESERPESLIAREFLKAMEMPYSDTNHQTSRISQENEKTIEHAFRQYDGTITSEIMSVMGGHGYHLVGGTRKHKKWRNNNPGYPVITMSSTPSDNNAGKNIARDVVRALRG